MIQNYFKIALRNFWKNSVYSTINILGLGIGMAGFIVILIYLNHELSYDQWNPELEKVYKISEKTDEEILSNTRAPLAGFLKEQDPLVANATRLSVYGDYEVLVSAGENKIYQKGLVEADSSFFHIFPYPFLQGDRTTAFNKLNSIIINQEVAAKLFGLKNPIGQTIRLHNAIDCEVTGIMDALSSPSHLQATMILLSPLEKSSNHWENFSYTTYVKTHRIVPVEELEKSVDRTYYEHRLKKDQMSFQDFRATGHQAGLFVDALQDLHRSPKNGASNIMTVSILLALSTLLLLSGTINFSNLSIATSMRRAKEVGVRKVMGASRKALFWQFLGEVALQCVVAFGIALLLVNILLPYFKQEFNIQLHLLQSGRLSVLFFWTALCLLAVIALSGLYPALFLSRYTTTRVLKGDHAGENKGFALRNALIVVQFTVSAFFVMAIVIINKQIQYMQTKDWGFSSEQVLRIQAPQKIREEQFDTFRNELLAIPGIIHVSKTTTVPGDLYADSTKWIFRHADQSIRLSSVKVSADYFNTLNIPLIQGRFFNETYSDQHTRSAIVNESGAKNLNLKNPIGSIIHFDGCDSIPVQIIGVVKDFNVSGFEQRIQPVIYTIGNEACAYQSGGAILLKLSGNNIATTVHSINQLWDKMEPDMPFRHSFLDENFRMLFANYIRLQWIVRFFGFTSVAIAMMGLFALTAFLVNQRTKEISIRKILGASLTDLGLLLSKDFIKLIALSVTLAIPLGWWAGSIWLQEFVYRISLNGWMFAIAGLSVLVIASITISLQTLKAALANPADSLRAE